MQAFGVASFFLCVVSMLFLFFNLELIGKISFGIALLLLMASLALSMREVSVSVDALEYRLSDLEQFKSHTDKPSTN